MNIGTLMKEMKIRRELPKKPAAIFFDLDGVILDSESVIIQSWKTAHDYICPEIEWSEEKLYSLMGQPVEAIIKGMGISEELHEEYLESFRNHLRKGYLPLFDDVITVLDKIKELSIPTCIITGADTESATEILNENNILHYFTEIIGADLTSRGKPFPDPIILALKKLKFEVYRNQVFFVGDSINDLRAAKAASVTAVLLWRKEQKIPQKWQQNADIIIYNLQNLLELFV